MRIPTENISHNYYLQKKVDYQVRNYAKVIDSLFSGLYPNIEYQIQVTTSDEFDNFNRIYYSFIEILFLNVSNSPIYKPENFSPAHQVYDLKTKLPLSLIEKWEVCETIYSYVPDALPYVKIKFHKMPDTFNHIWNIVEWEFRSDYVQFESERLLLKQKSDIMTSHMIQF
jgi:hypothetical protein